VIAAFDYADNLTAPAFSPDGKFCFMNVASGELVHVDISTGAIEPAGLKLPGLQSVQFHSSGRKIFFQAGRRQQEIWIAENILPRER